MVDSGIRTPPGFRTPVIPDTCIVQETNSADLNSTRHGQCQEKEKNARYWIEYLFWKKFPTENN